MRYKAITSAQDKEGNLTFAGKTCGVKFNKGVAHFDDVTIDNDLGLTAAEVADSMEKDFGYQVIRMNDDGTPYTPKPAAASPSTAKNKGKT